MHFVTGGSFNGKSKWVKEYYQLKDSNHLWISFYEKEQVLVNPVLVEDPMVILEGIEVWIKDLAAQYEVSQAREKWRLFLSSWLEWENKDGNRKVILIGTDISKGIVPMHAEERKWRDMTGWAYQDIARTADRVELIWYGISQKIK
ncbi:bifunctional adenosylcobinamide kinase/adenosylcobinamide-phosphate guanylyltransferase [Bacillus sp. FJAT-49705]|uniref:Adenosylcobinamide kinase n=1 Tax=Cytobacillus citreus TaxID=2833586 RepID=A0ABS5NZN0_9BACI|nr:bifunctional adenosylcobinamide kinase/adenosylcobinamide-phosphate guanylyltransferase [Cytobacillus citreus]MBS4192543.1 bifunctional adenosylcobinamide kinase/adenosylcobinamide-phosphate guanylyltransferase [Cytobacillus citreus]